MTLGDQNSKFSEISSRHSEQFSGQLSEKYGLYRVHKVTADYAHQTLDHHLEHAAFRRAKKKKKRD